MDRFCHLCSIANYLICLISLTVVYALTMPINNNVLLLGSKVDGSYVDTLASGLQRAVDECQHQFRWERWNCPPSDAFLHQSDHRPTANREMAFVHAVNAAGVMYSLARNCSTSSGQRLHRCSCDVRLQKPEQGGVDWSWRGCRDQFEFGEWISRQYVDSFSSGRDTLAAVQQHNYDAGRRAIYKTLRQSCKCHGVSGSCTMQTCWQALPHFREVGDYIRKRYNRARKVSLDNAPGVLDSGDAMMPATTGRPLIAGRPPSPTVRRTDLVYVEESPDYCWINRTRGVYRTLGRQCSRPDDGDINETSRAERKSCKNLCSSCGLAVLRTRVQTVKECNCRFKWCCEVKCDQCIEEETIYTCVLPQ